MPQSPVCASRRRSRALYKGKLALFVASAAALSAACAHGIDNELDLSDGEVPATGPTSGPTSGVGSGGEAGASTSAGSGGRGDPTGVGGTAGASGVTTSSSGGAGGSGGASTSTTGTGGNGGTGEIDAGLDAGQGGSSGPSGTGGSGGAGGAGGAAGSGGMAGAGGNGGVVVRDAGPFVTYDDTVAGTATNQFNYIGTWGHCTNCTSASTPPLHNMSNSWAGGADASGTEYMTFAFVGSEVHFYGVKDPRNGIGGVSIDGGSETKVDFYATTRAGDTLLFSSPVLSQGAHTFKLRVTSTKNASSAGTTITVDRIDVR